MIITTQIELGLLLDVEAEAEGYVPARRNGSGEPGPAGWDAPDGGWVGAPRIVLTEEDRKVILAKTLLHLDKIREPGRLEAMIGAILDVLSGGDFSTDAEDQLSEKADEEPYTGPDTREERDGLR